MQKNIYDAMQQLNALAPEGALNELATMSSSELRRAGLGTSGRQGDKWEKYVTSLEQADRAAAADPTDRDSVASAIFGEGYTADQVDDIAHQVNSMLRSGLFDATEATDLLNLYTNGEDGLGSSKRALSVLNKRVQKKGIRDAMANGVNADDQTLGSLRDFIARGANDPSYRVVAGAFENDDQIDSKEAQRIFNQAPGGWSQVSEIFDNKKLMDSLGPGAEEMLTKKVWDGWWQDEGEDLFRIASGGRDWGDINREINRVDEMLQRRSDANLAGFSAPDTLVAKDQYNEDFHNGLIDVVGALNDTYRKETSPILREAKFRELQTAREALRKYEVLTGKRF